MKIGSIERTSPKLDELVAKDATIEVLAEGFTWSEGPCWVGGAKDGHLLFLGYSAQQHFQVDSRFRHLAVHDSLRVHRRERITGWNRAAMD